MTGGLITSDPNVMMGKPVVAGTRITVELILEKLAAGETMEQLLEALLGSCAKDFRLLSDSPRKCFALMSSTRSPRRREAFG